MNIFITKHTYILLTLLLVYIPYSFSQDYTNCGTITTAKDLESFNKKIKPQIKADEQAFLIRKTGKSKLDQSINTIPLKIHVIRASNGTGGLDKYDINAALTNLNTIFSDAGIEFHLYDNINYINDDSLCHLKKGDETSLFKTNYVSGLINIYFTETVINNSEVNICGYSNNNEKKDIIVLNNNCAKNNSSLAHELGHIFSLIHTHGPDNNKMTTEFVDGSNCDTDGDGICDTPADPGLSSNIINNFCDYVGNKTDAHGDIFSPDTGNIMSYSRKACRDHFTPQQLARINAYFKFKKDRFSKTESKQSINLNALKVYPNPVIGKTLYINYSNTKDILNYTISNTLGQKFLSGRITNSRIDVSNLHSGSYLLIIYNEKSRIIKKIII